MRHKRPLLSSSSQPSRGESRVSKELQRKSPGDHVLPAGVHWALTMHHTPFRIMHVPDLFRIFLAIPGGAILIPVPANEEAKVQRSQLTCPKSYTCWGSGRDSKPLICRVVSFVAILHHLPQEWSGGLRSGAGVSSSRDRGAGGSLQSYAS